MKIGLMDVDSHRFPNLCLMKLSGFYKSRGDSVEWWKADARYDYIFKAKVFSNEYSPDIPDPENGFVVRGGTGYPGSGSLWPEIENACPDYSLYPEFPEAYGFLTRGCPRGCSFCIVGQKEGRISRRVAEIGQFWTGQPEIKLLDPNILACRERSDLLQELKDTGARVDFTQGLDIRFVDSEITRRLGDMRLRVVRFAWDNPNDDLAPLFARFTREYRRKSPSGKIVYVLVGYGSTLEQDLHRIYTLRELGYDPYVMVYNKSQCAPVIKSLQRWVNNRFIWRSCLRFEDYNRIVAK